MAKIESIFFLSISSLSLLPDITLIRGKALIEYVVDGIAPICDEILASVEKGSGPHFEEALGSEIKIVEDEHPDIGPIEGLRTGLKSAKGDIAIITPTDVPLITADFYKRLIDLCEGYDGAVPYVKGNYEPLLAVYSRIPMLEAVEKVIESGRRRPIQSYEFLNIRKVIPPIS